MVYSFLFPILLVLNENSYISEFKQTIRLHILSLVTLCGQGRKTMLEFFFYEYRDLNDPIELFTFNKRNEELSNVPLTICITRVLFSLEKYTELYL